MLIYMIRHGQTAWNAEGRLQGQKDIPLNETGRRQAAGNGAALKGILGAAAADFDFVASPLGRTRETMEILRRAMGLDPLAYRTDDRLVELSFGDWEGHTLPELMAEAPARVEERSHAKWNFIPPGDAAESYEILSWRIASWLANVRGPTVCVSHGGVFRAAFRLNGMDEEEAANTPIHQDRLLRIDATGMHWL
ncbi:MULTISPECIES: histidine phosphatase family protein [unclassified Shinella]|uniref:histidine phosphatase family protein n=1 Tax=unclassified Shinella TaxID=2643062 RepID=UPI00234E8A8E|nr:MULTISPECIES: histidine phosphatase family protein [unclassified Shinella]MCO5150225.1 phosphoglycerate mutase family protein [Shinella sp.]MDC7261172.1 phosphoglycerate mutase family protein [Shinella sp. HY16]MDC7268067.1 phosphoglycerate mutase family protein [Shinella sp. YZ44]